SRAMSCALQSPQRSAPADLPTALPTPALEEERDMSVKKYASALGRGRFRLRLVPFVVLAVVAALLGGFRTPMAQASSSPTTPMWSTQLDFDTHGPAWSASFFRGLKAAALTTAELNMPWATI